jgi:Flp pilus assembly protein protease CpaA
MKVFLLFLLMSFMIGATFQHATIQRRRWTMIAIAIFMVATYFTFDQWI